MKGKDVFSCCLIGDGALLVQCGELIMRRGHEIRGVVSCNEAVGRWAVRRGVGLFNLKDGYEAFLKEVEFDYLFSIVYLSVIPPEVLALPKKLAVNYHDGPLPRYAGIHATSWAIINGEKRHGITWHVMAERVDEGKILKQRIINIDQRETACTLNLKCWQQAFDSFSEIIEELEDNSCILKEQNPVGRSYYAKFKRPASGCLISWNMGGEQIDCFTRGLDFGEYENAMGTAKLAYGSKFFIVPGVQVLDSKSEAEPGTVIGCEGGRIRIATVTRDIRIDTLKRMDGSRIDPEELTGKYGLKVGDTFKTIDEGTAKRITDIYNESIRKEEYWVDKLSTLKPLPVPVAAKSSKKSGGYDLSFPVKVPEKLIANLDKAGDGWGGASLIVAAFCASMKEEREDGRYIDLGFGYEELKRELIGLEDIFAVNVPLRVWIDNVVGFESLCKVVADELTNVRAQKTYSLDIKARYPDVSRALTGKEGLCLPVAVEIIDSFEEYKPLNDSLICFAVTPVEGECRMFYSSEVFRENDAADLAKMITAFMETLFIGPH